MTSMNRAANNLVILGALAVLGACGSDGREPASSDADTPRVASDAPAVTFTPGESSTGSSKPGAPVKINYRIIGKPVVGQPVAIELHVTSTMGDQPIDLSYRINDATAMRLAKSQVNVVSMAPGTAGDFGTQQVTIIPQREGRLYLNVAAEIATDTGATSTVTAVPIQVGAAPRELQDNGVVTTDENDELIRTLPANED